MSVNSLAGRGRAWWCRSSGLWTKFRCCGNCCAVLNQWPKIWGSHQDDNSVPAWLIGGIMSECVHRQGLGRGIKDWTDARCCHLCVFKNRGKYLEITWCLKEKQALWSMWGRVGVRDLWGVHSPWASASCSSCGFSLKLRAAVTDERPGWALPRSLLRGRGHV